MPAVSATASQWVPLARKASSISFVYACFNVGARQCACLWGPRLSAAGCARPMVGGVGAAGVRWAGGPGR
jgi:hypothetical protein